jgi:hypothetical protein
VKELRIKFGDIQFSSTQKKEFEPIRFFQFNY